MIKENRRKNLESVGGGVLCGGGRAEHEGGNVQFLSRSTTYEVLERERTQRGCVSGFGWVSWGVRISKNKESEYTADVESIKHKRKLRQINK